MLKIQKVNFLHFRQTYTFKVVILPSAHACIELVTCAIFDPIHVICLPTTAVLTVRSATKEDQQEVIFISLVGWCERGWNTP